MCGLFGAKGTKALTAKEHAVVGILGCLSWLRGKDSTGIFCVKTTGEVNYHKSVLPSWEFMDTPKVARLLGYNTNIIAGHTRAATVGDVCMANAHPFEFDDIIGMHNGTMDRACVTQYLDPDKEYGTDSEALYSKINDSTFEDVIPKLEGAWALVAYDKVLKELNIIRNTKRTLFYAYSKNMEVMFWASEASFLKSAFDYCNYEIDKPNDTEGIFLFEEDVLNTCPLGALSWKTAPLKSTKIYTVYNAYNNHTRYNHHTRTYEPVSTPAKVPLAITNNVVPFEKAKSNVDLTYFRPRSDTAIEGKYILTEDDSRLSHEQFESVKDKTCHLCGEDLVFDEGLMVLSHKQVFNKSHEIVGVCLSCLEQDEGVIPLLRGIREKTIKSA